MPAENGLSLPYPDGPRSDDNRGERDRKIAENLEAIAAWLRDCGDEATGCGLDILGPDLKNGATEIDRFAEVVR